VSFDQEFTAEIEYELKKAIADVSIVLRIESESGTIIFTVEQVAIIFHVESSKMADHLLTPVAPNLFSVLRKYYLAIKGIPSRW